MEWILCRTHFCLQLAVATAPPVSIPGTGKVGEYLRSCGPSVCWSLWRSFWSLSRRLPPPSSVASRNALLTTHFIESHQAGVRLGGWSNLGGSPADSVDVAPLAYYLTDFTEANFYLEGYFGFRFNRMLVGELSVGIVNRGDLTLRDDLLEESRIGTLLVYPILAKIKLYPLGMVANRFHPYIMAGGGLYYGRHDVQIVSSSSSFYTAFDEDSETTFDYVLGGGFDWPLASVIGLDLNVQYMPIEFSNALVDVRDYSSFTITVGVKYLFKPQGKK